MRDAGQNEARLKDLLAATRVGKHERVAGRELDPRLRRLREWQAARLARTHADLLRDPNTADACRFFLTDVYAARDFSQRDHDITRMYETMRGVLPAPLGRALELVIELNALTAVLDDALVAALGDTDPITDEAYAAAYRACDNYDDRALQIDLVVAIGAELESLVRKPGVGFALKLARGPAYLAGWREMQDFFERGFSAFKKIRGARAFLATVAARERALLDELMGGEGRG